MIINNFLEAFSRGKISLFPQPGDFGLDPKPGGCCLNRTCEEEGYKDTLNREDQKSIMFSGLSLAGTRSTYLCKD